MAAELSSLPSGLGSKRKSAQIEALQTEIDGYLAAECPFCGDVMIRSIGEKLIGERNSSSNGGEEQAAAAAAKWEID